MLIETGTITTDDRAQLRPMNEATVDEYAEAMQAGATFPPVTVFTDGEARWLADGFHRLAAAQRAGLDTIDADVRDGTLRDAILYAAGANATHGLRRTNADKRRAVSALLDDPEWCEWSDREIARRCGVTHPFVAKLRRERSGNRYQVADSAVEGRARLGYQQTRSAADDIRHWINHLRFEVRVMVGLLDDTKAALSPTQYAEWRSSQLGMGSESEKALRILADDDTPAFIDGYLDWWTARQSKLTAV